MDHLPLFIQDWIQGPIDPHAQYRLETMTQIYLISLAIISFFVSYLTKSVLYALEIFGGGVLLILILAVPPWPFLTSRPIKFLPVRTAQTLPSS